MAFTHDVFISYAHDDRAFARRLKDDLAKLDPASRIFFDQASLRAGDDWEERLGEAIEGTRSLVVFWSERAKESDWVTRELYSFLLRANPRVNSERRLVFVNLQGANKAMHAFHQIAIAELQSAYPDDAKVTDALWQTLAQRVHAGLDPDMRPLVIPLVVLTLTQTEAAALGADAWTKLSAAFHLPVALLRSRYGVSRDAWRPFNGTDSIAAVLADVAKQVNVRLAKRQIVWKTPDDAFWEQGADAADRFIDDEFEKGELAVLIVDPVALGYLPVYQRLMLFQESLASRRTVVLTLPPFGGPGRILRLRQALLAAGKPYFDPYLKPEVPPRRRVAAYCDWNVTGASDIERLILAAAGHLAEDTEPRKPSAFLRHGALG